MIVQTKGLEKEKHWI